MNVIPQRYHILVRQIVANKFYVPSTFKFKLLIACYVG
jgi:hypothetical protein